jgi:hypothetical protein
MPVMSWMAEAGTTLFAPVMVRTSLLAEWGTTSSMAV